MPLARRVALFGQEGIAGLFPVRPTLWVFGFGGGQEQAEQFAPATVSQARQIEQHPLLDQAMGAGLALFLGGSALAGLDQPRRRHAGLGGAVVGLLQPDQGRQELVIRRRAVGLLGQEHQKLLVFGASLQALEIRHALP